LIKKTGAIVLKIAVTVGFYVIIFLKVDVAQLLSQLRNTRISFFVAACFVYIAIQGLSAYRWYLLLRPLGLGTPYRKLLSYYFLGMFFNQFLPTSIGGDLMRVYYLNKETRTLSGSTASVFLDRDLGMLALLIIALAAATIAGTTFNGFLLAPIFAGILVLFIGANLALFYRPTYNLLHKVLALLRMKRADVRVERLFNSVNSFRGNGSLITWTMVLSFLIQFGCTVVNMLCAIAIGMTTRNGWLDFLVFIPATGLISMAPVGVNGMGWREASYIVLFQTVILNSAKPGAQAFALSVLWLAVLVLTSLPGGLIYLMQGGKQKANDGEEAARMASAF